MSSEQQLVSLFKAVEGLDQLLILPHNDPDPDAVAAAVALSRLLSARSTLRPTIAYAGLIGRAENKALVNYLDQPLELLSNLVLPPAIPVALVDTQPGMGNNTIPAGSPVVAVIDHHPWREGSALATLADVRVDIGSTSTILTEYYQVSGLEPDQKLATALFYGVKTDTLGLTRGTALADIAAFFYLRPRIDVDCLLEIERAQVPLGYFKSFDAALRAARIYDHRIVISYIGAMTYPDLAAELADVLLRLEGTEWVVCLGHYGEELILAVRTTRPAGGAGLLAQGVVGKQGSAGGHGTMAGGHILLLGRNPKNIATRVARLVLKHLNLAPDLKGQPLV
ncbi:MAG: DHH family phosphoesterase [Anaerolineales bacterium]|nr:DHH family phosphoesterase [Anaerolineales bacterium]